MIYQFDSRVRYSEVDENRRITLLSILNYFQDCSSFHSEKIGFGIDYLKEKQCAWVLSSWQQASACGKSADKGYDADAQ